tara:strand:+ start:34 stop:2412 length:2379 start_codon:yes stop_codon:yes gene_type:complete
MKINRREFLSLTGKSAAGAMIFAACGLPEKELVVQSPVGYPEDLVRGEDAWYATSMPDYTNGDGVIVRVVQGRATKVEGNPDHPVNRGVATARYDSTLQILYHPDRIKEPLSRYSKSGNVINVSWNKATNDLRNIIRDSKDKITVITNPTRGHSSYVTNEFAKKFGAKIMHFDPINQNIQQTTMKRIFDLDRLPHFDIDNAKTILSFGADWLSTWNSPAQYNEMYGNFREGKNGKRGYFVHVDPRMSNTAASADLWLSPIPGTEGDLALGIANEIISKKLVDQKNINKFLSIIDFDMGEFSTSNVAKKCDISEEKIKEVAKHFAEHTPSIAFAGGSSEAHTNGSFITSAVYSLNILTNSINTKGGILPNPEGILQKINSSANGKSISEWEQEIERWSNEDVKTLIIRGVDIIHGMPDFTGIKEAMGKIDNVVCFGHVYNDTMDYADLILPENTCFESWDTNIPEPAPGYQVLGTQQPIVGQTMTSDGTGIISNSKSYGDLILQVSKDLGENIGTSMESIIKNDLKDLHSSVTGGSIISTNSENFTNGILQRGGWWNINNKSQSDDFQISTKSISKIKSNSNFSSVEHHSNDEHKSDEKKHSEDFYLAPFISNSMLDGRLAYAPWAQQTPDPISSASWSTWVEINSHEAESLNIREGDVLKISSSNGSIEALAYPHPGIRPGVIGIPLGQGNKNGGRYAEGRGANILSILADMRDKESGALAWAATKVTINKTGNRKKVPKMEGDVEARPVEPGVPVLVVGPNETAKEAQEHNHHQYQKELFEKKDSKSKSDH